MGKRVENNAEPPLFAGVGSDGHQYAFVVRGNGCCAITRDGKVIKAWSHEDFGIDTAVDEYCALTDPAGRKTVSARVRAFADNPRSRPIKGRGHVRQPAEFAKDQSS